MQLASLPIEGYGKGLSGTEDGDSLAKTNAVACETILFVDTWRYATNRFYTGKKAKALTTKNLSKKTVPLGKGNSTDLPINRHWIRLRWTLYGNGLIDAYAIVIELVLAINSWCNTAYRFCKRY